jgi:2-keto-4-pentenoate hydratase/2-oxohepta-3-ene-1,7-dioic acid hydratase in catechol pathway
MFSMRKRSRWRFRRSLHCSCKAFRSSIANLLTLPFRKPETALADPWPAPSVIPKCTAAEKSCDYESELAIIIGRSAKDVSEAEAMNFVLGYTAANDISARQSQFAQSQWCYSKGFDGACPIGPTVVSPALVPDPGVLRLRGIKNGRVLQECGVE